MINFFLLIENDFANIAAIPKFHDCLRDKQGNAVLILELLGQNLQTKRKLNGGWFTIKTTMMIGCQLVSSRILKNFLSIHFKLF